MGRMGKAPGDTVLRQKGFETKELTGNRWSDLKAGLGEAVVTLHLTAGLLCLQDLGALLYLASQGQTVAGHSGQRGMSCGSSRLLLSPGLFSYLP